MKELIPQNNLPQKQEKVSYYEYKNQEILGAVKHFESELPSEPEKLIEARNRLESMENEVAHNLGAEITKIEIDSFDDFFHIANRIQNSEDREKAKEVRHALLDMMHAINRKLNQLGHEEK